MKISNNQRVVSRRLLLQFVGFTYCSGSARSRRGVSSEVLPGSALSGVSLQEEVQGAELDQGPLKRSSSLLVRIGIKEVINKEEVVGWKKFWQALGRGHGEKLAHGVVGVLLLGTVKDGQGAQEQHWWCPGCRSPIRHRGAHEKKVELSNINVSKWLVIYMHCEINCSCLGKCYSCCSFVYFVKVECFGWLIASPKPPPLGVLELFICNDVESESC